MGVVLSLVEVSVSVTGSSVGLCTVLCGLHSVCSGSALLCTAGLQEVHRAQDSVGKHAAEYLSRLRSAWDSPQKAASVWLLSPLAMLLWMLSLQCFLLCRVVSVQHTGQVALPALVGALGVLFVAPKLWWYLMMAAGLLAPLLTLLVAEQSACRADAEALAEAEQEAEGPVEEADEAAHVSDMDGEGE
ncbi:unnamed protein product [Durusdinium trenchii]|uniref:Uncharacterized protein n=2 Tax=Durusdinium trenchii TaxID=1381693 RepID=A0ABP0JV74_9DINO